MKKAFIAVLVALLALGGNAMAQKTIKLGHINSNDLMQIMPGRDSAQAALQKDVDELKAELEEEVSDLEQELKNMQAELEKRYNEYQAGQAGWSDLIKQTKQSELQDMSARIEQFQQNAQKQLQEREAAVLKPIIDRAKKAIEDVAKENGYTYIFDAGVGTLLYSQDSDDIMPMVKKKLGLK